MDSLNKMFSLIKAINIKLYKKSENEELNLIENYLFEASSYFISIIHEKEISNNITYTTLYMYKSLIEVIEIIYMILNGEIKDDNSDLLNKYNDLIEKEIYDEYKSHLSDKEFRFKMKNNNDIDINIIKEQLSYLFYDYDEITLKNTPKLYEYYKFIKTFTLPNDIKLSYELINSNDFKNKMNIVDSGIITLLSIFSLKLYPEITFKDKYSLTYEKNYIINHPDKNTYLNYINKQIEILNEIGKLTNSNIYNLLGKTILNLSVDKLYDFTETLDTKIISLLEVFSYMLFYDGNNSDICVDKLINYVYDDENKKYYIKLLYDESKKLNHINGYMIKSQIDINYEYTNIIMFIDDFIIKLFDDLKMKDENMEKLIKLYINIVKNKSQFDLNLDIV